MANNNVDILDAYNAIKSCSFRDGKYNKCLFHLHTPESHDYCLLNEWNEKQYKEATEEEIFSICKKRNLFPESFKLEKLKMKGIDEDIYNSKKEAMSFLLLIYELAKIGIQIVTLADHNTVKGFKKMQVAIDNLKELCIIPNNNYPKIILGVEISCADKIHVAVIGDDNQYSYLNNWLDNNLVSIEAGSYETSLKVLEELNKINGITAYIAHINSSPMLTPRENFLNNAYKTKLLQLKCIEILGIKDINTQEKVKTYISQYKKNGKIKFLLESDSHAIDNLDTNIMWIKGASKNYKMLKTALVDYDVSFLLGNNSLPEKRKYIAGLYLDSKESFLKGKNNTPMVMSFSDGLNCLIGGRGTGKSTIIDILEYIMSQKCNDLESLNFICSHGNMWILYIADEKEYIIEMRNPYLGTDKYEGEKILQYFRKKSENNRFYYDLTRFNQKEIQEYARYKYVRVYEVMNKNNRPYFEPVKYKQKVLDEFFDRTYSVNHLVATASDSKINDFILNTMFKNKELKFPSRLIRFNNIDSFKKNVSNANFYLDKRKKDVLTVINPYNEKMKGKLYIKYTQDNTVKPPDFALLLDIRKQKKYHFYKKYNIKNENLIDYLEFKFENYGPIDFFKNIFNKSDELLKDKRIIDFVSPDNIKFTKYIEKNIDDSSFETFLNEIYNNIIRNENIDYLKNYFKESIDNMECFTIEFNVETNSRNKNYKNISVLSLGQKVVAMLDFILSYSEYSNDYRPLIIDQPEDNLDNRYIYDHLVNELRKIKSKRQIIIATHNSTIVTNAMSDLVIVMDSDGKNGWIKKCGYPGETSIKKEIINCLEGGIPSITHKFETYKEIIDKD